MNQPLSPGVNKGSWWTQLVAMVNSPAGQAAATPATSSAAGTPGQVSFDASYLYVCVAKNSWKRIALGAF